MNSCKVCAVSTKNKCSNCYQVAYCSAEHQKSDWKTHKINCYPFKIEYNEQLGRHLIATRTIKPFEIIIKEAPLMRGPSQITAPVCLGCLNEIDPTDYVTCEKCGWPLCGAECNNNSDHQPECALTAKRERKINIQDFTNPHPLYQCVSTVRCLSLYKTDKWQLFQELESLEDQRRGSMQWKADLESIVRFIPKFFKTNNYEENIIMKAVGILQTNGHEVPTTDPPHVAIFHKASFLEHSCSPNLAKSFNKDGHIMLWSPKGIKKNEHLSICYSDVVWGVAERQQHLMHTKLFYCSCPRCMDITEFNTNYNAIKCSEKSCIGLLTPATYKEWNKCWSCNTCGKQVDMLYISNILERAGKDKQAVGKTVDNYLKFIQHYQKWLPPTHAYICQIKLQLVQALGNDPKELQELSNEQLNLKIQYAKELLTLYELLAPCEARMIGMLCYELHSAIAEYSRRVSLESEIMPKNLLEESLHYVERCVDYLQYETDLFMEGHVYKQAKINRDTLRLVLKT